MKDSKALLPACLRERKRFIRSYQFQLSLRTAINQYVATLTIPAQIEWNTSAEVWRSSPMVEYMRVTFGWSVEQMDQMFRDAEQL